MPFEYQNASRQFEQFMLDARDLAELPTTNMAWNMVVGVLHTFRRRLQPHEVVLFANALPPVLRSLFIEDWDITQGVLAFTSRTSLLDEIRATRRQHNFSPDHARQAVATALWRHVDAAAFEKVLQQLSEPAQTYWRSV